MLTQAQRQELIALAQSLEAQGKSQQEVQAAIDSKKAEMLGDNTTEEAISIDEVSEPDVLSEENLATAIKKETDKANTIYEFYAKKGTVPGNLSFEGEYKVSREDLVNTVKSGKKAKGEAFDEERDVAEYIEEQRKKGKYLGQTVSESVNIAKDLSRMPEEEVKKAEVYFDNIAKTPTEEVPAMMTMGTLYDMSSPRTTIKSKDPLITGFIEQAEKELKDRNPKNNYIPKSQINNLAKEYYIADREKEYLTKQVEEQAENAELTIPEEFGMYPESAAKKKELLQLQKNKAKGLEQLAKSDFKNILTEKEVLDKESQKIGEFVKNIRNVKLTTPKEQSTYNKLITDATEKSAFLAEKYNELDSKTAEAIKKTESADLIEDLVKRDYGGITQVQTNLAAATLELTGSILTTPSWFAEGIKLLDVEETTGNKDKEVNFFDGLFSIGQAISKEGELIREGVARPKSVTDIEDIGDFGMFFSNLVANQIPQLVTIAATGGGSFLGSMAAMAVPSIGGKYLEMVNEMDKNPNLNYTRGQLFAAPFITGMAEGLSEKVTFNQMKILKAAFSKNKSLRESIQAYVKGQTWGGIGQGIIEEGGTEVLAQGTENIVDAFMLDKDIKWDRGLIDAFASGALLSAGVFKAPLVFKKVFNPFRSRDTELEIARGQRLINSLSEELEGLDDTKAEDIEQIKYIGEAIADIKAKQVKYLAKDLNSIDNLTTEQKEELVNIDGEIGNIRAEAGVLDRNIKSEQAKDVALQPLNERYNQLVERKNTILQSANEAVYDAPSLERSTLENYQAKGLTKDFYLNKRVELLNNEITNLEKLKEGVKDPERLAMLDLKIKNRQAQLAYSVPAAMGASFSFTNATGLKKASLNFVDKSRQLLEQLNAKQIDQKEYNKKYKALQASYQRQRAKLASAPKEFNKLQAIYDRVMEESNTPKTKGSRIQNEGTRSKATNEYLKAAAPIIEYVTQRLYDKAGKDRTGDLTRDNFKLLVGSEIIELIENEFDPTKQTLDKFISTRENLRSQRLATKEIKQDDNSSLDNLLNDSGGTVSEAMEQEMVVEDAQEKIDSAKALGIELDSETIERELLKNYDVDSKSFKRDIKSGFVNQFRDKIDAFMGKNTKTSQDFSNKLAENAEAIYDTLTVESMRMARGEGGLNPFEEAGMLVFKNGQLEKVAFKNIDKAELVNYFSDPNIKKQARSNRQKSLKEAMTISVAAAHAIKILNTNKTLQDRIVDLNQLKADVAANLSPFQKDFNVSENEFATYDKDWSKYADEFGHQDYDLNNDTQREEFLNKLKSSGLTKLLPASFFLNFNGSTDPKIFKGEYVKTLDGKLILQKDYKKLPKPKPSIERARSGNIFFMNVAEAQAWVAENGPFAKEKESYSWIGKQKTAYGKLVNGKKQLSLKENFKNKEWLKNEDNKLVALEDIFTIFQNFMVKDGNVNKENAALVAALLKSTSSWQGHFIRKASPVKFTAIGKMYDENNKPLFDEEHTLPASAVAKYLFSSAINGNIKKDFKNVKKNFFQGPLLKEFDSRLAGKGPDGRGFNYKAKTPSGWLMTDNIWARYFNPNVNNVRGGIDPNKIILRNGKSVAEEFNVGFDGKVTADVLKAQQEGIAEQTDKVEFIIDRAIAKLEELTGTKGFAIDPFLILAAKDVSLNVLVGGLRAVKVAYNAGKNITKAIDAGYDYVKKYMTEREWLEFANLATREIINEKTPAQVRLSIYSEAGVLAAQEKIRKEGKNLLRELGVDVGNLSTDEINKRLGILSKARAVAMNKKAPKKKARVFDFDDTLAKSKSNVLYLLPDGTTGSLTATEFAEQSGELAELGAQFDFSEFSTVKDGSKGPLAVLAKKLTEAKGDRDIFVLTARPAAAAESIQSFLRSALGISIPLENITGLGDGTAGAKAYWMAEKVSEGYNDLFFADDAPKNVAAVDKMLTDLGVKKKVQLAKETDTKSLEDEMDSILRSKKPTKGSILRRLNIYVPPGADDFAGLLYTFLGKGPIGNAQMKFFQDNIMTPFAQGISAYETAKVTLGRDYKALKKRYKNKKALKEKVVDGLYTKEQAVRAYLYNGAGYDLDISKADVADLLSVVQGDAALKAFADDLAKITKIPEGYPPITPDWLGGSIQTDLANVSNKAQRAEFLTEFINNKNQMFSDQNIRLIRQMHGNDFTDALENVLERMETGVNRKKGKDKEFNQALNWLNASVANIMSFNTRSAILQQLSAVNFMNWTFNNPFMMAKAMANVPQFAKDFGALFNSDFLLERRGGLKIEINTADLANTEPGNWFTKTHKKLLQAGFLPTQYGDSFAIAFGGATWYRNNINRLIKEGVSEADAIKQTMVEFQEIAETSQQSSRPDKVSRQQASDIGRLILAFANTPMQYARLTKKATLDLVNGRGDWKTNASKIVYYGVAQNLIFTALQSALFSMLLDDDDDVTEDDEKKLMYAANSIIDGTLRGMGYGGAVIAALKNLGMELYDQNQKREKGERVYNGALTLVQKGLSISPPLSKKIGDIVDAQRYQEWRQYKHSPFYQNYAKANYVSGILNIPVDRVFKKLENMNAMSAEYNDAWQNVLLGLGWSPYSVDVDLRQIRRQRHMKKEDSPLDKKDPLEPGVLGKAHKDGTIQVKEGLSPAKKKEVIAHEKKHIADMSGPNPRLGYDSSNVYWDGKAYPRLQGKKIMYNGVAYLEGHKKLPWEKSANGIKV